MNDTEFKSIKIDLENDVFEINGCDTKGFPITKLHLSFDGIWELTFTQELVGSYKKEPQ